MPNNPECILLHSIKYGDKSLIIKTLHPNGIQSFFVKSYLKKGKNVYPFLSTPLSIIEPVFGNTNNTHLATVKDISLAYIPKNIPSDIIRQSVALFMADVLFHLVREENDRLSDIFYYTIIAIQTLDNAIHSIGLIPLKFGFDIAALLGYGIRIAKNNELYFNTDSISFQEEYEKDCLTKNQSSLLNDILSIKIDQIDTLIYENESSKEIFKLMLNFYKNNIPEARILKSPEILKNIYK